MLAPGLSFVCHHDYRWSRPAPPNERCDRPRLMHCVWCRDSMTAECKATSRAKCGPCSERHRKRVATIARGGMKWDGRRDRVMFVTLTPPGQDVLPWDRSVCTHAGDVKCSGPLGCRVQAGHAARWNAGGTRRFDWFRRDLARVLGVHKVEHFSTWETHQRGVVHRHSLFAIPLGVSERRFRAALRLTSLRQGFGRQLDVQPARQGAEWYVAKYATKSVDELPELRHVEQGEVIFSGRFRPWSQSRGWFMSMGTLKKVQRSWWSFGGAAADGGAGGRGDAGDGGAGALDTYSRSSAFGLDWVEVCPADPLPLTG